MLHVTEEGEGDFFFDEAEVMNGLDGESRSALLAGQAAGMELEEGQEELEEVSHIGEGKGTTARAHTHTLRMQVCPSFCFSQLLV